MLHHFNVGLNPWTNGSEVNLVTEILQYSEDWEETLPSTPTQEYLEDWET